MKKLILIIIALMSVHFANAQDVYQYGKLILKTGDTIICQIDVYEPYLFVSNHDLLGKEVVKYKLDDIVNRIHLDEVKELYLDTLRYHRIKYVYKTVPIHGMDAKEIQEDRFVAVLIDSKCKLFKSGEVKKNSMGIYQSFPTSALMNANKETWNLYKYLDIDYFILANNKIFKISSIGFKNDSKKAFSDCLQILKKLDDKTFKYKQIEDLVKFANENCY